MVFVLILCLSAVAGAAAVAMETNEKLELVAETGCRALARKFAAGPERDER